MSKLGEVVYCVDCDAAREGEPDRPRRMATKRDANGTPLCTACLDARHERRRGTFLLHEGRAPLPASRPPLEPETPEERSSPAPVKASATRVLRIRERPARAHQVGTLARPKKQRRPRSQQGSQSVANDRDRRFVLLAVELGFLRAQQLLDELSHAIGAVGLKSGAR